MVANGRPFAREVAAIRAIGAGVRVGFRTGSAEPVNQGATVMWPLSSEECYVSIDIEADGPVPGLHSMLSLGAAAFTSDGALEQTFSVNLETLAEAHEDARTMRWWASQPAAWEACRVHTQEPKQALQSFHAWVELQARSVGLPVMVAFPAAYDAMWVQWYLHRFVGDDPFRRRAIDIKTLAMVAMGAGYRATAKSGLPRHWRPPARHTHIAVEDAIEQGELFMNILYELNGQRGAIAPPSSSKAARRHRLEQRQARGRSRPGRHHGDDEA